MPLCHQNLLYIACMHASFGFSFDNMYYSLNDQKKAALQSLKIGIINKVSMVKVGMLYQLDLRLKEITENVGVPF